MKVRYSRAVRLSNSARSSGTTPIRRLTSRGGVGRGKIGFQNPHRAAAGRQQAGEHLDGRRFARAVRAEKAEELSRFDPQIESVNRARRPETARQPDWSQRQASRLSLFSGDALLDQDVAEVFIFLGIAGLGDLLVAFDVAAEQIGHKRNLPIPNAVDDVLMRLDASAPVLLHRLAETLEEDLEQIAECRQGRQAARFDKKLVKRRIQSDVISRIGRMPQLFVQLVQPAIDFRVGRHPGGYVGDDSRFDDDARIDELGVRHVVHGRVKAERFLQPSDVHSPHGQPAPRLGLEDAQEPQRLGGFAHADAADAEALGQLALGRQVIAGLQIVAGNVLLDLVDQNVAGFSSLQLQHGQDSFVRFGSMWARERTVPIFASARIGLSPFNPLISTSIVGS